MPDKEFDYDSLVEEAMRGVVAKALAQAAEHGLPGHHHFYISFRTTEPGVRIPARLKAQYPDEMTIVLQYQYWNLHAHDDGFEVELAFGGKRERLWIPYAAMTGFVDPHARFGLKFGPDAHEDAAPATDPEADAPSDPDSDHRPGPPPAKDGEKIVSLDHFRKK